MRLAISTNWNSSRYDTAAEMLEEITFLRFDAVEMGYALTRNQAEEVLRFRDEGKIRITSLHAFCPMQTKGVVTPELYSITDPLDYNGRKEGIMALKETVKYAHDAGIERIVLHAGRVPINDQVAKLESLIKNGYYDTPRYQKQLEFMNEAREEVSEKFFKILCLSLEEVLPFCEKNGIILGLENLPTFDAVPSEPELVRLFDMFDTPHLGYWHDIGHGQVRENLGHISHAGIVSRLANKIVGMHIHDVFDIVCDHYMPPGGSVDFSQFKKLVTEHQEIPLVLEPGRAVDELSIVKALRYLKRLWEL